MTTRIFRRSWLILWPAIKPRGWSWSRKLTQEQGEAPIIGGTVEAIVILRYDVHEKDAESALANAVAFADENGWKIRQGPLPGVTDEIFVGEKDLDVGLGRIVLAVNRDDTASESSGTVTLGINLGFDHLYEEETD